MLWQGGVCLLFLTLGFSVAYQSAAKKLAVMVGGAKRLYSLSTFVSFVLLLPWALFVYMRIEVRIPGWPLVLKLLKTP